MFNSKTHVSTNPHLKQSAIVCESVLPIPAGVIHFVSSAGQQQIVGTVEGCWVNGVAVDQADQVLPVMLSRNQYTTMLA